MVELHWDGCRKLASLLVAALVVSAKSGELVVRVWARLVGQLECRDNRAVRAGCDPGQSRINKRIAPCLLSWAEEGRVGGAVTTCDLAW